MEVCAFGEINSTFIGRVSDKKVIRIMTFSLHDNDPSIIRGTCEKKRPVWKSYNDRVTKRGSQEKRVSRPFSFPSFVPCAP